MLSGDLAPLAPVLIFIAGGLYVTLDTVRIIAVSRGMRHVAAAVAFLIIIVFTVAFVEILSGPMSVLNIVAYAAGYWAGTYVGIAVESKVAVGNVMARVVLRRDPKPLVAALEAIGLEVVDVAARSTTGRSRLLFAILPRRKSALFHETVRRLAPEALVSVQDVRSVQRAVAAPAPTFLLPARLRGRQTREVPL